MPNELLNTAQAARELNVHRSTLTRMVKAGKIKPAVKGDGLRGEMFFRIADVRRVKERLASAVAS